MKAQTSFLMKGIYLILVLVTIAIVLNQIVGLNLQTKNEEKNLDVQRTANNILETLVGSSNCLAYEETSEVGEKTVPLSTHRVIDKNKLESFTKKYSDVEPECARDYKYRFSVEVEKYNLTRIFERKYPQIPFPGNRDIVLIFDNSGSMKGGKLDTARAAALKMIDCADSTDRLAVVIFGDGQGDSYVCDAIQKTKLTFLDNESKSYFTGVLSTVQAFFGTPLEKSLKKAVEVLEKESTDPGRSKMIILMTDGGENCCNGCESCKCGKTYECVNYCKDSLCNNVEKIVPKGIPVFPIGFLVDALAEKALKCVASKTNGIYFPATESELAKIFCEIGGGEILKENVERWSFGVQDHSYSDALKSSVSISTGVPIRYGETKVQPGLVTIIVYDGELERLTGLVDNVCSTGIEMSEDMILSYATYTKTVGNKNLICMNSGKEFCSVFSCKRDVEMPDLAPGHYLLKAGLENGKIVVKV
jgi:hypothetical protein